MADKAILALEDGRVFHGHRFGAAADTGGEVVFTTSMTGYQEICTDPSYKAHIVCLTYPIIGSYGINAEDDESRRPWLAGLVVREYCADYSNWRATGDLHTYLEGAGVPGIYGVDTRALTKHIRSVGSRRGVITGRLDEAEAVRRAGELLWPAQQNVVGQVSAESSYSFNSAEEQQPDLRLVIVDCGLKENILRSLSRRGVEVVVVPYNARVEDIVGLRPDGVLTSPGPGDPQNAAPAIKTIASLLELRVPFFGICLGHQLMALALGATTRRLKFGHRGGNHPVLELATGKVYITSQNHGYEVDTGSVPAGQGWYVSHINLNDRSVEGLSHPVLPAFSVQYHPEGSPGPQDSQYLFDKFLNLIVSARSGEPGTARLGGRAGPFAVSASPTQTNVSEGSDSQDV